MRNKKVIHIRGINHGEAFLLKCEEKNSKMRRKRIEKMTDLTALFYAI